MTKGLLFSCLCLGFLIQIQAQTILDINHCPQESEADFILQNDQNSIDLIALNNNNSTIQNKTIVIYCDFYTPPIA